MHDEKGEIYTVRYDQVNAMLLNEFLKEHRAFIKEQLKVAEQQKEIDALREELKEQRYLIQKVSDKIDVSQSTTSKWLDANPESCDAVVTCSVRCLSADSPSDRELHLTCHSAIVSTAVALSLPTRNRSSAVLASSNANVSVCVRTGTRGAISKIRPRRVGSGLPLR